MKIHKSSHKQVTLERRTKYIGSFQRISWVYDKNDLKKLIICLSFPPCYSLKAFYALKR